MGVAAPGISHIWQWVQDVHDALYRLSSKTYPDTTGGEYIYELAGKVQQVSDPTGIYGFAYYNFAYYNMGRLISTTTNYTFVPCPTKVVLKG